LSRSHKGLKLDRYGQRAQHVGVRKVIPLLQSNATRGILLMLAATLSFVTTDTLCKLAMETTPPLQALFMRNAFAALFGVSAALAMGIFGQWPGLFHPWVVIRAVCEFAGVMIFFICLSQMPLAELTALIQIAPLIILLCAALFFGDTIGAKRIPLILGGFAGALMVADPARASFSWITILGLCIPVLAACRDIMTRKIPSGLHGLLPSLSVILITLFGAGTAHLSFEKTTSMSLDVVLLFAFAGFFLLLGQLFILAAFRAAPTRTVAPFLYAFMVWALISGVVVFEERPSILALGGMALIVGCGLALGFMSRDEKRPVAAQS
jgi:drug/metabolite transporter (DMT)-like permease